MMKSNIALTLSLIFVSVAAQAQSEDSYVKIRNVCDPMKKQVLASYGFESLARELDGEFDRLGLTGPITELKQLKLELRRLNFQRWDLGVKLQVAIKEESFLEADTLKKQLKPIESRVAPLEAALKAKEGQIAKIVKDSQLPILTEVVHDPEDKVSSTKTESGFALEREIPEPHRLSVSWGFKEKFKNIMVFKSFNGVTQYFFSQNENAADESRNYPVRASELIDVLAQEQGCK